jgi:transcription-repair coupling factor (superfamily II helicase)
MQLILNKIRELPQYQQLLKQLQIAGQLPGLGLPRAARLPILAAMLEDLKRPVLFITDRSDHALSLFDELSFWVKSPRYHFAEPNPLFYEQAAWGVTTRRERLQTLTALSAYHLPFAHKPEFPPVFVTSVRSLMTRTLPRRDFLKACRKLSINQTIQPDTLCEVGGDRASARQHRSERTILQPRRHPRYLGDCGKNASSSGLLWG